MIFSTSAKDADLVDIRKVFGNIFIECNAGTPMILSILLKNQ